MKKYTSLFTVIVVLLLAVVPAVDGATLNVNPAAPTGQNNYATIGSAIAAAQDGDTIVVSPGLYNERITINKAITLNGATAGVSKKGYNVPENYRYKESKESIIAPQDTQNAPVVTIEKGDVTFDGFIVSMTFAGSYPQYAPTELVRMTAGGNLNNVKIQNNVIGPNTNLASQDGNAGRMGITISKWSKSPATRLDNTVYNLQIRNNKIFDAKGDGCGILMIGEKNTSAASLQNQFKGAVIDNNEITGNHRSGIDFSGGVQGGPNAADHIKITNNIISDNGWNSTVDKDNLKWGNGIVLIRMTDQVNDKTPWASRYIDITNNEFSGNEKNGIYIGPITRDVTITGNTIKDNGLGSYKNHHGYSIWDGIRIDLDEAYQPPSNQKIYDYLTNLVINENTIQDNGGYGLQVIQTPQNGPIDARKNWWGASSGPLNAAVNPSGTGDAVTDNVRFAPWYTSDSKTTTQSPAAGSALTLTVSQNNFTTIQKAINGASPGDTIRIFPGTYNERIVIDKSLTLLGATNGISKKDYVVPAGYVYDETKESIISPSAKENVPVVQIKKSPVTFDGFIVNFIYSTEYPAVPYPTTDLISLSDMYYNYSDVRIENNVIGPNTNLLSQNGKQGRMGIVVPGPSSYAVYNLTIANNKIFNATGDGCGIMLLGSSNSTAPGLAAKYQGSTIFNNTISGNHRAGIEFSGGVQGGATAAKHFRITNNTISGNGWNSTVDKNNVTFGNGIVMIHIRSQKDEPLEWGSRYIDIDNNRIADNEKNGIYIGPINKDISITNNVINSNGAGTSGYSTWDGVQVDLDESYHNPTLKRYGFLSGILVKGNEITANGNYGVRVIKTPTLGSIDARNNWWGDASGPKTSKNPSNAADRVSDNVAFSPWYTSPLKNSTSIEIQKPMAAFTVNPVEAMKEETFSFDGSASAEQSATGIASYQWNFGDNNVSAASASPLTSHNYKSAKVFTITLTVKDLNGVTNQTTRQVTVIAKKEVVPLKFNGTTISGEKGKQEIAFDTTKVNGTMSNTTTGVTIANPGNGWAEMVVVGNTTGDAAGSVTVQNISEVVLKSAPTVTQLDTSPGGAGAVTTSLKLSLTEFSNAPIQIAVSEGANASVANAFQLAAGSGTNVDAVAYTMSIQGTSLINSNLSAPVILNMSVSKSWVDAHGGISAIKVIRFSDDGATKEVLKTTYLFTDEATAMCYLEVESPNGCSIFGVTAVSAVPQSSSPSSSGAYTGSYGGSGNSFVANNPPPAAPPKVVNEFKAPPMEFPDFTGPTQDQISSPRVQRLPYLSLAPAGIPLYDQIVAILIRSENYPAGIFGGILTFVVSNLVTLTCVIMLSVACAFGIIWFGDRRKFWR